MVETTLILYYVGILVLSLNGLMFAARVQQEKRLRSQEAHLRRLIAILQLKKRRR